LTAERVTDRNDGVRTPPLAQIFFPSSSTPPVTRSYSSHPPLSSYVKFVVLVLCQGTKLKAEGNGHPHAMSISKILRTLSPVRIA